jgi:xylose isomerase
VAPGESLDDVRNATYDLDALRARSVAMEALDQLAMEHLLGVR